MKTKMIVSMLGMLVLATSAGDAEAWPPPPPPPPHLPPPPPPPLPPFHIDSASFATHPGTVIEAAGTNCPSTSDWLRIRGDNVALATHVDISQSGDINWERRGASSACLGPNCLEIYVQA